jgi:hypothetical protein
MLFRRRQITSNKHYGTLVLALVDKLADYKSIVRDAVLELTALLID